MLAKPQVYICDQCFRIMWLRIQDFYLEVLTQPPEDPEEGGIMRYPVFTSGAHDWRVEADTAEIRVWNSLKDPVAVIAYDDAVLDHGRLCQQCCPRRPSYRERSSEEKERARELQLSLDTHRKAKFGHIRILR